MRVGYAAQGLASCLVCGNRYKGTDAEYELLEHLRLIHDRFLVNKQERKRKGEVIAWDYLGNNWPAPYGKW